MAKQWTERQQKAIAAKDKFTILSAAAGSGKTSVLVERAVRILADESNPVSADRLLIVTFSNASAAEFKKRIDDSLSRLMAQNPDSAYLSRQRVKLQNADISTIDAFCIKLARENFQILDISPDAGICDDIRTEQIHRQAIDRAMNYGYGLENFSGLVSFFGKSSTDRDIRDFLQKMFTFFSVLPNPGKQAKEMAESYSSYRDMRLSPAYKKEAETVKQIAAYTLSLAEQADKMYQKSRSTGYETSLEARLATGEKITRLANGENWRELSALIKAGPDKIGRVKGGADEYSIATKDIYDEYKKAFEEIDLRLDYLDEDKYAYDISLTEDYVRVLFRVFDFYLAKLTEIKKKRNMFEFSDYEQFALQLLQNDGEEPTGLCKSLQDHYLYIMEDEYQDTNEVQDRIFTLLSQNTKNLYVVGDIKQAIYGFRGRSSEIFLAKRELEKADRDKNQTLYLPHNFRSSYGIIGGVNYIFRNIMTKGCGGVDYDEKEELRTLNEAVIEKSVMLKLYPENEEKNVAMLISDMIKSGFKITVDYKTGEERPVTAGDFCILLRNSKKTDIFKKEIEKLGHRAFVRDSRLMINRPEVQRVVNLLRVISNPTEEVYLTAAMFGDIFGFSLDEILKIRNENKAENLYRALALTKSEKAEKMLDFLKDFAYRASVLSADKLIDEICRKTGYFRRLAFTENGGEKRENLRRFIGFAKNYAQSHGGENLPAFLRRIERYMASGKGSKSDITDDSAVSIMTMHTSKGLEYPICIVAGLDTKFNKKDISSKLLFDKEIGVGMYAQKSFGYNFSTLNVRAIKDKIAENLANEEMRLLYVAMTRAKNTLILTGECPGEKSLSALLNKSAGGVRAYALRKMANPLAWIISALARHPYFTNSLSPATEDRSIPQSIDIEIADSETCDDSRQEAEIPQREIQADMEKILENLAFKYPNRERTALPIKMSVSEIAKERQITLAKPDFINENKITAAEKGTAMHRFAQYADILKARQDLYGEIQRLENAGLVQPKLLNINALKTFVNSSLADRILKAEKVYTERNFRAPYPAQLATGKAEYVGYEVLVQGVMDCVLQNGNRITVIDYKTDYVENMGQLKERYEKQLELYRHGAKALFNTDNVKCLLYSFRLGQFIEF